MKLSKNFTLSEFTYSETAHEYGIENTPVRSVVLNLKQLCANILQPLRDHLQRAVRISSGYRSPVVNALVGGSETSKHMNGQASDIYVKNMTSFDVAKTIIDLNLDFHQLIIYPTFVHVSYVNSKLAPKRQILYSKNYSGERI